MDGEYTPTDKGGIYKSAKSIGVLALCPDSLRGD